MPNLDAGTYFLTIFAPVKQGPVPRDFAAKAGSWDVRFRLAIEAQSTVAAMEGKLEGELSWPQRLRMVLSTSVKIFGAMKAPLFGRCSGNGASKARCAPSSTPIST